MTAYESFDLVKDALDLPADAEMWRKGWEESQKYFPTGLPRFLTRSAVRTACRTIRLADEAAQPLLDHLSTFADSAPVCRLAWHLHRRMTVQPGTLEADVRSWPLLPTSDRLPGADLFFAYLFLAQVPRLAAWYDRRGIPRTIFLATMADVELWMREHRKKTGRWGLSEHKWLIHHFSGNLFQLGRLQFQFGTSRYPYHAWRHRESGRVLLFPRNRLRVSSDGKAVGTDTELTHVATYHVDTHTVSGLPVNPRGFVSARLLTLDRAEWGLVLQPGDPVLNIHIPAGSPMDFDQCGESFALAREFFSTHFPQFAYRAFVCGSWLLDPQLEQVLRPDSNISRFLREVYLFPLPDAGDSAILRRVFGSATVDPETAPRDTSLQRAVLDYMKAGGRWRSGGCLLFPEDLPWGHQAYRRGKQ